VDELLEAFLKRISPHIVALTGQAVPVDASGNPKGRKQFFSHSGFVIRYSGLWVYVTAGHVLRQLDEQIRDKKIKLLHSHLGDYFATDLDVGFAAPFDYPNAMKLYIDDDKLGVDVGFMLISPLYQASMIDRKVQPFVMDGWESVMPRNFKRYVLVGLPEEKFDRSTRIGVKGESIIGAVRLALMMAWESDAVPKQKPQPENPWLAIQLGDDGRVNNIVGMSGGPILGILIEEDCYTVAGVQSWWDPERRVCFGTPISVVMELLMGLVQEAINPDNGDTEK
jgi:hypothetical protein